MGSGSIISEQKWGFQYCTVLYTVCYHFFKANYFGGEGVLVAVVSIPFHAGTCNSILVGARIQLFLLRPIVIWWIGVGVSSCFVHTHAGAYKLHAGAQIQLFLLTHIVIPCNCPLSSFLPPMLCWLSHWTVGSAFTHFTHARLKK